MQPQRPEVCPACGRYPDVARFCLRCGVLNSHPQSGDRAAPYLYRLAAEALDLLIFALGVIPWLIWMWYTARDGQSPAKRLLGMYVLAEDGQPITPQRMWMRELGIKRLLFGLLGYLFVGLPTIVDGGWMMLNPDRQCVHDRMVGTLVVLRREPRSAALPAVEAPAADAVVLPPPAPPAALPAPPPRPAPLPAAEPPALPPELPPELIELERRRGELSQFEYERRWADLRRRLLEEIEEKDRRSGG